MHFCCRSIYQLCNYFIENFWSHTCQSHLILRQTWILGRVSFLVHCSLLVLASHVVVCLEKRRGWEVGLVDNQISPCTCPPSLKALPRAFELFWTAPPSPFSPSIASSACGSCPSASSLYCSPPDQTVVFPVYHQTYFSETSLRRLSLTLRCSSHLLSASTKTAFQAASVVPYSGPGKDQ